MSALKSVSNYLSLIKFSHTLFAMPFAIIGFLIAIKFNNVKFEWQTFVLVIFCMVFARNAAMAFNRYIDREIDKKNLRTTIREIPSGIITPKSALIFVVLNSLLFIATTYFINQLCFWLSPVALIIILGYSLTKRFTFLCHIILGVGLGLAPIGAFIAVTGEFHILPLFFSFAVLFWVSGFDIIYALQDEEFDKEQNLKSLPAYLGKTKALNLSSILHFFSAACIIAAGFYGDFGLFYWIGTVLFCALLVYQHTLVKPTDLSKINLAFFTLNGIASLIFSAFVIADFYL